MSKRVLVVDDDRAIAHLAGVWLKSAGFEPELAFDGLSALAAAHARRPDAVVMDLRMPGLDGLAVRARMAADRTLADVPVIFLTANAQETARHHALSAGARGFLTKPYDAQELIGAIWQAMEPREHRQVG